MIPKYLHLLFIQLKVVATKIYPLIEPIQFYKGIIIILILNISRIQICVYIVLEFI